jgi:NADH-quinone oxidoreductase subunit L
MVFVFWELVGICSYFLIGFYIERKSASNAANKAFIVNRVGDFGMIIGLMVIWSTLGTFSFGDITRTDADGHATTEPGIFSLVRPGPDHQLIVPDGMVQADAKEPVTRPDEKTVMVSSVARIVLDHSSSAEGLNSAASEIAARTPDWRAQGFGYWLLVLAGLGIFCGCVGKSAQFPLHVWLPDAMEGPTPVSALVHSATMVAAGVYLVGRFFPAFAPEVLLVIAIIGTITMLLGASIAFAAYDIKRVLAYSTVSQLGLMMLSLGLGGWLAGLMHLVTHAFFKSPCSCARAR